MIKRGRTSRDQPLEEIRGTVERITFRSEETGFSVLRVQVDGRHDLSTVIGSMPNVVVGETVRGEGQWVVDPQHGRQFKADKLETSAPDSIEGIEKFLGSGLIKGIGPKYAKRLVETFGKDVFRVIENRSAALEKVKGIGRGRRETIKQSWNATRATRAIMSFLLSHGVSTARAFRIYKTYGENAIKVLEDNPYVLARDIRGIGFKTADQIARNFGIEVTSDLRARAGVEYVLFECTARGHCAVSMNTLMEEAVRILTIPEEIIERAIAFCASEQRIVEEKNPGEDTLLYPAYLFTAESELARDLKALSRGEHPAQIQDGRKAVTWAAKQVGIELAPAQRLAVQMALEAKVMVITGGPGVGKTTILNAVIEILAAKQLKIKLAAPTGRAAKRMSEATGRQALTIHRLLEFDPKSNGFKRDRRSPLDADVVVVDESSMIDLPLAHALVKAVAPHAALILVGDVDQLPSVGPGMVLRDVISSEQFEVARLRDVFRQAAESQIVISAHRVNQGQMPQLGQTSGDFYFVRAEEPEKIIQNIRELIVNRIPTRFKLDPRRDVQVLTPMQKSLLGARNLNLELQRAMNPVGEQCEVMGIIYRVGDKVMQTMNNYDKEVYNGDIGVIREIDLTHRELAVVFPDRKVYYDFNELDELVQSYAITIHKSQGSEYPCVIIPVHTQHYVMLQRNLIYTAITRGKQLVLLVGTEKALGMAVRSTGSGKRITRLSQRLREA